MRWCWWCLLRGTLNVCAFVKIRRQAARGSTRCGSWQGDDIVVTLAKSLLTRHPSWYALSFARTTMHPHNQGNMNNYGGYQPNEERIRAIQARIMANAWAMQQQAERDGLRPLAAPTQQRQIVNDPAQPPPLQHTAPAAAQQQPPPPSAERVQQPTPERQATAARGRQHQASAGAASKPRKVSHIHILRPSSLYANHPISSNACQRPMTPLRHQQLHRPPFRQSRLVLLRSHSKRSRRTTIKRRRQTPISLSEISPKVGIFVAAPRNRTAGVSRALSAVK